MEPDYRTIGGTGGLLYGQVSDRCILGYQGSLYYCIATSLSGLQLAYAFESLSAIWWYIACYIPRVGMTLFGPIV